MNNLECECNIIHKEKVDKTTNQMLKEETFDKLSEFFKILGDKTRMKILFTSVRETTASIGTTGSGSRPILPIRCHLNRKAISSSILRK